MSPGFTSILFCGVSTTILLCWEKGDDLYDSIKIVHDTRWDLPLLSLKDTLAYMAGVHEALIERLDGNIASEEDSFIYQFATFHEDMHDEAFLWTRQTLAYPKPNLVLARQESLLDVNAGAMPGDVEIPGGMFQLGSSPQAHFLFDNEKWAHAVRVDPFKIARAPVTNVQYAAFIQDDGYSRRELWDEDGWRWRTKSNTVHPVYWRRDGAGDWHLRRFHEHIPLPPSPAGHSCQLVRGQCVLPLGGPAFTHRAGMGGRRCGRGNGERQRTGARETPLSLGGYPFDAAAGQSGWACTGLHRCGGAAGR